MTFAMDFCPLCYAADAAPFHEDARRTYLRCSACRLVFVPPWQFVSLQAEKAEYDLHQNSPQDPGYRRFLSRLFDPLQASLGANSRGLDFGSGPGPTLSVMFEEAGHQVALYDPFYAHEPAVFDRTYDFITASEVVEHLHHPRRELDRLWRSLKPGGTLGLMTKLVLNRKAFSTWHYRQDMTHVCFFSQPTFRWLADQWRAALAFVEHDVVLLRKEV